jgi:TonB family protein
VEASIRRNGDILELRINASSGIPALDEAAEKALRRAVLPPLPDDYPDEVFEFILVFWYNEKPYDRT